MNFMIFHEVFFSDVLDKYVVDISLADEEIKQTEYSTNFLISGGSIKNKNSQHPSICFILLLKHSQ